MSLGRSAIPLPVLRWWGAPGSPIPLLGAPAYRAAHVRFIQRVAPRTWAYTVIPVLPYRAVVTAFIYRAQPSPDTYEVPA